MHPADIECITFLNTILKKESLDEWRLDFKIWDGIDEGNTIYEKKIINLRWRSGRANWSLGLHEIAHALVGKYIGTTDEDNHGRPFVEHFQRLASTYLTPIQDERS